MKARNLITSTATLALSLTLPGLVRAQETPAPADTPSAPTQQPPPDAAVSEEEGETVVLSPFEVTASTEGSYTEANTLAGNRLNTELRDLGNAVQVINAQFLKDTGATSNETLLQYTTNTEVANYFGNFTGLGDGPQLNETAQFLNPNQNTRVRGLTAADNARDYFLTDIPWDSYNVDRVDLQRGPNSILFGQGSPGGIVNSSTKQAGMRDAGEVEVRIDDEGSMRGAIDYNKVLIKDQLAVRVAAVSDDQKFKQKPAFQDSERVFGAIRYEPAFLKKGSARTIFRANFEDGSIDSNRPRSLPPGDYITPWFYTGTYTGRYDRSGNLVPGTDPAYPANRVTAGQPRTYQNLNRMTINPHTAQNDNFYRSQFPHGLTRPAINGGTYGGYINPYYNPWIGAFGASIGGPVGYYADGSGGSPTVISQEISETWGISSTGTRDRSLGYDFNRLVGIAPYADFARNARLQFAEFGIYKNRSLTDSSVFDFYEQLIDGDNKKEWQDFSAFNLNLAQTFFDDKFGFEASYNEEDYKNGQLSLLTDTRQAIYIDFNKVHTDGTHAGVGTFPNNVPFDDGTPNPNLGRPFISDNGQFGNNSFASNRNSRRLTGFFIHDFDAEGDGLLGNILGKHTITGLVAEDERTTENRSWMRYGILDPQYRAFLDTTAKFNEGQTFVPSTVIYLGDSLLNATSAAGANIRRPRSVVTFPASTSMRIFDSHWANRPGVDPAAEWLNTFYPADQTAQYVSTQSENPANYVGWVNMPLNVTDSETSRQNRDTLTTSARLQRALTTSKALVWQAELLDGALVGTFGIRKDRAQGWSLAVNTDSPNTPVSSNLPHPYTLVWGHLNLDPAIYHMPTKAEVDAEAGNPRYLGRYSDLEETSKSWMAVVHFDELPFLKKALDGLPVHISAFYNESTNFQPEALRVDVYGEQIGLPKGETTDFGLLFETRDRKYSFKVNRYKTDVTNANSSGLSNAGFIGSSQAWGANWANAFQYDFGVNNQPSGQVITSQVNDRPANAANAPGWSPTFREGNPTWDPTNSLYNYGVDAGETQEQAAAREASVVAAWRQWQQSVDPRFYAAWGIDLNAPFSASNPRGVTSSTPNGFALTEDATSEGYEFELSGQPIRNLRLSINASKTKATRKNIGGANLQEFISAYEAALSNGAVGSAGDLRIWWGGSGNETTNFQWYRNVGAEWAQRKLQEGTNVPELREWRVNAIASYDFTEGRLRGLTVGGGLRWQDEIVVGYPAIPGETATDLSFDIGNPYMGPAETNVDLWFGYQRKLRDKIRWRIQLNIRNVFQGDDLIPVTVQPDGSPAAFRIAPPRNITLTNTFSF